MSDVEQVEKVLAELRSKRDALVARGVELGEARQQVAFSAHTGDAAARKKLDAINREAALHDSELRSLDAAIAEAGTRVEAARHAEEQAQAREVAKELLARAHAIVEHARALDDANTVRVAEGAALSEELELLRALGQRIGVHVPNHQQLLAMGSRAERTTMALTPWAREVGEAIAPNERRNHTSYAVPWRDQIVKAAGVLMGDKQEAA
jgi:hypothetical protein